MSNRRVGEPVVSCPRGASHQENNSNHSDCDIEITSICDPNENEYKNSQEDIFVKTLVQTLENETPLCIKYETRSCNMDVTVWIEYQPSNAIHSTFYDSYQGNGVSGRKIAILVDSESKEPGEHQFLWDGRDKTSDHRILLEGTYTIFIQGLHEVTLSAQTTIKIGRAPAYNFGIHYYKRHFNHTTKIEIEHARDKQQQLSDGTAFNAESQLACIASDVWESIEKSAVTMTSTHSNAIALYLHSEKSTPNNRVRFNRSHSSHISFFRTRGDSENDVVLTDKAEDCLRDVLLMVIMGCHSGDEIYLVQMRLNYISQYIDPGRIDGDFGNKTRKALKAWQKYEEHETHICEEYHVDDVNGATLFDLGIDISLSGEDLTRAIQEKLKYFSRRYNPGRADGRWDSQLERAITNYQEDHSPPLDVNSLIDNKTLEHLKIGDSEGLVDLNLVNAYIRRGCNIAIGFKKSVTFVAGKHWNMNFWDNLSSGLGIEQAANDALIRCPRREHRELEFTIKTLDGVDSNETLHPARYGKDINA